MNHQPWQRIGSGKRYVTTEPITAYGVTIHAGFEFQVSVPNWMTWPINPHDKRWLWASLFHDWALKQGWSKWDASTLMARAMRDRFERWARGWIPPAFIATLVFTLLRPLLSGRHTNS